MAALPAGTFAYVASGKLILDAPGEIRESPALTSPQVLGFTNDHKHVVVKATVGGNSRVRLWDLDSNTIVAPAVDSYSPIVGNRQNFGAAGLDEAHNRVLTTGGLLDLVAGTVSATAWFVAATMQDLQFSPDGERLYVTYSSAPWLRIFEVATGTQLTLPFTLTATPRTVRVSPDETLISMGFDSLTRARTYRLDTGALVQDIPLAYADYYAAHYAADGSRLVWSMPSETASLRVFDVPSSGGFAASVYASGALGQDHAALVGGGRILVNNDYNSLHGGSNWGYLVDEADGAYERLLAGTVGSTAVPPAFVLPPATPAFWTNFIRTLETP